MNDSELTLMLKKRLKTIHMLLVVNIFVIVMGYIVHPTTVLCGLITLVGLVGVRFGFTMSIIESRINDRTLNEVFDGKS